MAKHLWCSGATDTTGMALALALGITSTKTKPRNIVAGDLIIGWGAKTDAATLMNNATIWNHPDKIRDNRNKLESLQKMMADNRLSSHIAKFVASGDAMRSIGRADGVKLPLIGRTNYHQGGKGLWICLTKAHVDQAITSGAQYFQEFIDIKDEYRLHVMFGEVVYAVKKTANPEPNSWIASRKEKIEEYAAKNEWVLDQETLNRALSVLVKEAQLPDYIVRSNRRGWKFVSVNTNNLNAALKAAAIHTVATIGLQFGAVDCAMDSGNRPYIIEVNSGPGLQGTAFDKYVEVFRAKIAEFDVEQRRREDPPVRRAVRAAGNAVRRAVGAAAMEEVQEAQAVNEDALVHLMNAVRNPEEARRVLDLMARRR